MLFLLVSGFVINGCASSPPVVKIGLVGPFTGRYRDIGYDVIYSARLAVREANEAGGIGKYRLNLVALDDFGDPDMARANSLALSKDPAVVAVIGNWLPETTHVAASIYELEEIPYIVTGEMPFGIQDPAELPLEFIKDYEKVTPFDEVAGPYTGSGYDAAQLIIAALTQAESNSGSIDRSEVNKAMENLTVEGLIGPIYR